MKRKPSLHIGKNDFKRIIGAVLGMSDEDRLEGLTNEVFYRARAHSIHTRTITVSSDRMEKKAKRLVNASRRDADLLADVMHKRRITLKHRGIIRLDPGHRDWPIVKEIAAHALNFTNEFELRRRYGFIKYVEIGLSKMKKFSLNKFTPMYQGICESYEAQLEIEKDDDPDYTKEMYMYYSQRIIENTGMHDNMEEMPDKYVWFVRARKQAEKLNISGTIYMKAQFAGLSFTDGKPHPSQLTGPKATDRVVSYCYKEGIKIKG